jgi:hypothetical protein
MATIQFSDSTDAILETPAPAATAPAPVSPTTDGTVAVKQDATIAAPTSHNTPVMAVGVEGEVTNEDLKPPRINLVQKSGSLCDTFSPGTFLYERAIVLAKPTDPINVVPLRLKKYYQQKLEYGSSTEFPLRADTAAEVREQGGSLMFGHDNYYQEVADILLAVEAPADMDEETMAFFPYEHDGKNYGLAVYTVAASAYTSLAKRLLTDAAMLLRDGLYLGNYELRSELKKSATNSWHVPVASFVSKHKTPEAAEFFRGLANL